MAEARSCDEDYMKGIEDLLSEQLDYRTVRRQGNVTGGIINKASLYNTHAGQVFVKYANRANVSYEQPNGTKRLRHICRGLCTLVADLGNMRNIVYM